MDEDWYYGVGDDTLGPMRFDALVAALRDRPDWRDIQVWCGDFADWRRAAEVHQIAFLLARAAPPGPATPAPVQAPPSPQKKPMSQPAPHPAPITRAETNAQTRARGTLAPPDRRLWIAGAAAAAFIVLIAAAALAFWPFSSPLERTFARVIAETKPTLPKKADDSISLTDVTASGTRITYQHVWDGPRFALPNNLGGLMRTRKLGEICASAKDIFTQGGSVEYAFRSQSGLFIASFEVKKEDCG